MIIQISHLRKINNSKMMKNLILMFRLKEKTVKDIQIKIHNTKKIKIRQWNRSI